jgi:phosphatidylglycerol---prolipoprotein diacylglyceryl transferase
MHPILLKIGSFQLPSYRVFIAMGGLLYFYLLNRRRKDMGLGGKDDFWLLVNMIAISGFIGARLGYLLLETRFGTPDFWQGFMVVNSEFSMFGFMAGVLAGTFCFSKIRSLDFPRLLDPVFLLLPLWMFFARLGCFMAGCCQGRPTRLHLPWAVTVDSSNPADPQAHLDVPLHPAQLYEAAGNLLLLLLLYTVGWRRIRRGALPRGLVCAGYLAGYGGLRFVLEWFRADTKPLFSVFTVGQALCTGLMALGFFAGAACWRRAKSLPAEIAVNQTMGTLKQPIKESP